VVGGRAEGHLDRESASLVPDPPPVTCSDQSLRHSQSVHDWPPRGAGRGKEVTNREQDLRSRHARAAFAPRRPSTQVKVSGEDPGVGCEPCQPWPTEPSHPGGNGTRRTPSETARPPPALAAPGERAAIATASIARFPQRRIHREYERVALIRSPERRRSRSETPGPAEGRRLDASSVPCWRCRDHVIESNSAGCSGELDEAEVPRRLGHGAPLLPLGAHLEICLSVAGERGVAAPLIRPADHTRSREMRNRCIHGHAHAAPDREPVDEDDTAPLAEGESARRASRRELKRPCGLESVCGRARPIGHGRGCRLYRQQDSRRD
jgi:hypothetical protein